MEGELVTQRLFLAGFRDDFEDKTGSMDLVCDALLHQQCGPCTDI